MYNKDAWEKYPDNKEVMEFAEGYKEFLSYCKTEREVVKLSIKLAEAKASNPFLATLDSAPAIRSTRSTRTKTSPLLSLANTKSRKGFASWEPILIPPGWTSNPILCMRDLDLRY